MITDQKINKKIVGVYLIDGINDGVRLATTKKPNYFHRLCMRIFLGWKWIEIKK